VPIRNIFSKCFSSCYIKNNWIGGMSNVQGGNKKFMHFRNLSIMRSSDLSRKSGSDTGLWEQEEQYCLHFLTK
jgi:hypothetical protein